jgi:tetratricopeptide (TPR) repeat protein
LTVLFWAGLAHATDKLALAPPEAWVKPVAIPATPAGPDDNKPVRNLVTDYQVRFDEGGEAIFEHAALRIQAPAGLAAGNVVLSWNPDTDTLTVHEVRIIRGAQVIDVLHDQTFTVLRRETDLERAMLNGVLTATLQPAGLQVGDVLEVSYTLTRHDPVMHGHSEAALSLNPNVVVDQFQLRELWPSTKQIRWRQTEGLSPAVISKTPGGTELVVSEQHAERPKPPKGAPPRFNYLSVLEASDFQHWSDISALLAPLFETAATLAPDSPLKAEAAKIRSASTDPKARAAAALKLVQDKIRYLFLGMNQGGYVPAPADLTWSRRFGDCKGKTVVLLALLHDLGIEAEPVLVSSGLGDGMDERLPMVELFDHVLVRARIGGADYWLDGTRMGDRSLDTIEPPPFRWGLPLETKGADLVKIEQRPLTSPQFSLSVRFDASAGLDAVAAAHLETVFSGEAATALKLGLSTKSADDADKQLRQFWTSQYAWIEIKSVSASFDDAAGEERLVMDGVASMAWNRNAAFKTREYETDGSGLAGAPDLKRDPGPHADAPYAVGFPSFFKSNETIILPQGGKGFTVAGENVDKTIGGVEYKRLSRIDGGVFTMDASTRAVAPEFPAADAQAVKVGLNEISDVDVRIRAPQDYAPSDHELQLRLARTPTLASEFIDRAGARALKADYDGAIADYGAALNLRPDDAELLNSRCFTRGIADRALDLALTDCNAAIDQKPHNAAYLDSRGFVYFRMGALDKAVSDLNAALDVAPDQAPTLYVRGLIERRRGDAAHGDADVAAAKALDPTVVATYAGYGVKP